MNDRRIYIYFERALRIMGTKRKQKGKPGSRKRELIKKERTKTVRNNSK